MRELHVVAVSDDGRHVILAGRAGAASGGYRVALDDRLAAALRGDLVKPGEEPAGTDLTPRDIQARLRAGESAEAIALSAGVPVARVERFSGPVQGEMARIIDEARSCYLVRGRLGQSVLPMGEAVDEALAHLLVSHPDTTEWTTRRDDDGTWLVSVAWVARARSRTASWRYDPTARTLTAMDPASAALGHRDVDSPASPRKLPTAPAPKPAVSRTAKKAPAKKTPAKKAPARKAPTKQTAAKKSAAQKSAAQKSAARKAPAKPAKSPAKKAASKPAPAKKAPAKRAPAKAPAKKAPAKTTAAKARARKALVKKAPAKAPATKAPANKATARKAPTTVTKPTAARTGPATTRGSRATGGGVLRVVPDPVARRKPRKTTAPAADRARATVPGWADVLLGTTPGADR